MTAPGTAPGVAGSSEAAVGRSRRLWRWALATWTVVVWSSRISNALRDEDLDGPGRAMAVLVAAGFVALALALIATMIGPSSISSPRTHRIVVEVLAALGIIRWTLNAPVILLSAEWSAGFKIVHTILWLVTVGLSALAVRELGTAHNRRHRDEGTSR